MNVMLLAAGEGTRLRPYTLTLPKPAMPFLTVPLAAHSLGFLRGHAIDKLVVNTFHLPGKIHELFHTLPHQAKHLYFSDETGAILGSGGGLGKARNHFIGGGDFVMMNADEVILAQDSDLLKKAFEYHKKNKALATLFVMEHPGVGNQFGGVWTDEQQKVLGFGKNKIATAHKGWHFVGVQILSEKVFQYIPLTGESNILYDALTMGLQQGELVQTYPFQCSWFETGNPHDFFSASESCFQYLSSPEQNFQKSALLSTLKEFTKEEIQIDLQKKYHSLISQSAHLNKNIILEGLFVAGKNCVIGKDSRLKNVIVGDGVIIPDNTEATDQIFI